MKRLDISTKRGPLLTSVLFSNEKSRDADTVMIAITGIHGNFYSNPFYYNIGNMADYVMFFERQGVEIAVSTEYFFGKYGTALRCVVRFGVAADDTDALKAYKVALS